MRLNRLQRIGIVISILWALGAGYFERAHQVEFGQKWMAISSQACYDENPKSFDSCYQKNFDIFMKPNWGNIGFFALAPIPLGWLIVFIFIRVYRWVKAGKS